MSRPESEEEDAALPPPGCTMLTKHIRNDGACHGKPDAEGSDAESDSDVEKNSTSRRAISHERCFRHLVEIVASRLHFLVKHSLLMFCVQ